MKLLALFIITVLSCKNSQNILVQKGTNFSDTINYCQIHSPWVSTCLVFYKKNKIANNGLFEKTMESDDGQHWYGKGRFIEKSNKIILSGFSLIRTLNNIQDTSQIESLIFIKSRDSLILNDDKTNIQTIFLKQKQ